LRVRTMKALSCCGSIEVSRHRAHSKPVKSAATGKLTRRKRLRKLFRMQRKRRKKRSRRLWRTGKLSKLGRDTIVAVSLKFLMFYANNYCAAISDLAWSPDNMHFASCSTDSTISIWHINEHCKFFKV